MISEEAYKISSNRYSGVLVFGPSGNDTEYFKENEFNIPVIFCNRRIDGYSSVIIDDFLAGELRRWKNQQIENEISAGDSYVHIYKNSNSKIIQQSKGLGKIDAERVFPVCTRVDGRIVLRDVIEKILKRENLNAHSFRHTHATILIEIYLY